METKREIRKIILNRRDSLTKDSIQQKSRQIFDCLIHTPEYQKAEAVLFFSGYQSEPDTSFMMERSIQEGKKVYCPKVMGDTMVFYRINTLLDLQLGYKGILEPTDKGKSYDRFDIESDLLIMPGVAFDKKMNRIGYGKGFYDRFLANGFKGKRIAICFDLQIIEENRIEFEETDIKPQNIITETGRLNDES